MLETMGCTNMVDERIASGKLEAGINSAINMREQEILASFNTLRDLVRRTSIMPGQRTIVLVSPGFLSNDVKAEESEVIDLAIRTQSGQSVLWMPALCTPKTATPAGSASAFPSGPIRHITLPVLPTCPSSRPTRRIPRNTRQSNCRKTS